MFTRLLFVMLIVLGFAGTASVQAQEIVYVPRVITPLKSVAGFHPEDADRYKQLQRVADYAHTAAGYSKDYRNILSEQAAQYVADVAYVGAELVLAAETLKAKLDAHVKDEAATTAWASKVRDFATAVTMADDARVKDAEAVPLTDCNTIPHATVAEVNTCIVETRAMKSAAQQKAQDNLSTLDKLIAGDLNVAKIRKLIAQ